MNAEQLKSTIRTVLISLFSTIGGVMLVARGWVSQEQLFSFINGPLGGALIDAVVTAGLAALGAYGIKMNSATNLADAAGNTGSKVIATPDIAKATPDNPNVVSSVAELPADTPKTPAAAVKQAEEKKP